MVQVIIAIMLTILAIIESIKIYRSFGKAKLIVEREAEVYEEKLIFYRLKQVSELSKLTIKVDKGSFVGEVSIYTAEEIKQMVHNAENKY